MGQMPRKRKYCKTFYAKRESVMRLPKDTALNQMDFSSDFSKLYVFGSICYALQPPKLLHQLEERSAKGLFLGIDPAGYKLLDLQSKVAYIARTVKCLRWQVSLFRRKLNSRPLSRRGTNTLKFFGRKAIRSQV